MRVRAITVALLAGLILPGAAPRAQPAEGWSPKSEYKGEFDWIQMKSGEWVKGEISVMYEKDLEFDSDEFDDLVLGWDDINVMHTSQVMVVGLTLQRSATGTLHLEGDTLTVTGEGGEVRQFHRKEVISLTAGEPKEINFWSAKLFAGVIVRRGNSDVRENNLQANIKRRTVKDRITIDVVVNENVTDGESISNNQRATAGWDRFISDRFFFSPVFGEYFRDPFQNIERRWTVGGGAGYQLIDKSKLSWDVNGGPAYQTSRFVEVVPPQSQTVDTPALVISTVAEWDITKWLEFDGTYRAQFVNRESGTYNHHLLVSLESEITSLIDFDVSWIWDRIEDPQPTSDGTVPAQDDFRTTVGLTFEF